jgi:hypothetical protein
MVRRMKIMGIAGALLVGLGVAACGGSSGQPGGTAGHGGGGTTGGGAGTTGGGAGTTGGGAGSHGSCGTVQPCGGAIAGVWKATSACILDASLVGDTGIKQICSTASIEVTSVNINGTSTFRADDTYASTGTLMIGLKLTMPLSCFSTGKTCADLQAAYEQQGTFDAPTCNVLGTACICSLASTRDMSDSGTYSTSGAAITTTGTDGTPSTDQYCVKGSELHDIGIDMTMPMGPMGMAKIQGDFVFAKQ